MHPTVGWLTVNRKCNFRCRWCYAAGTDYSPGKEMTLDRAKKLCDIVREAGVQKIIIIGGEPTLWQPLIQFNEICSKIDLHTILVTNGFRFGDDRFWENYRQCPNDSIGLSLKAGSLKQLKDVTGVINFDRMQLGVTRALELNAGISITYNTFYTENLIDLVQFAVDCGAKSVKIDFCSTTFRDGKPDATYMVEPHKLASRIMRDYPKINQITKGSIVFEMMVPFCLWPPEFINELRDKSQILSVCQVYKRAGVIFDEAGNLIMCNALFDYSIGTYGMDFHDSASLLVFLNSHAVTTYYDRISCYPSLVCEKCSWYDECGGGCPLRWAVYQPDTLVIPHLSTRP